MSSLTVRNLSKQFRARRVVKDISLMVNDGEIVGLLGPNGAGKTTSFHMIVGLLSVDSGSIHLNDKDITRLPIDQRSRLGIGYLPQDSSVFRNMTVADNIMAILELRPTLTRARAQKRLENLLREFNIAHIRDSLGASLSGGERRRLEIARALATEPRFLLLDEPFAGIDPISISDIQRITEYLSQHGIGILITDHNVRETLGTCDRAYIVNDGSILAQGTAEDVLKDEQVRKIYLGEEFSL